jgi:hypothetical protein
MKLVDLELIRPGETASRVDYLQAFRDKLISKHGFDVEPISYHDIECAWVRVKTPKGYYSFGPDHYSPYTVEGLTGLLKT